jgi:hypothetical protein
MLHAHITSALVAMGSVVVVVGNVPGRGTATAAKKRVSLEVVPGGSHLHTVLMACQ